MASQAEQYGLYISLVVPIIGSIQPLRKAYYIHQYLLETDPRTKIMIAGRANLSEPEKEVSDLFLQRYKAVPRRLARIPLLFFAVEFTIGGYGMLKRWMGSKK